MALQDSERAVAFRVASIDRLVFIPIAVAAVCGALSLALEPITRISVEPAALVGWEIQFAFFLAVFCFTAYIAHRTRHDDAPFDRAVNAVTSRMRDYSAYSLITIPAVFTIGLMSFNAVATGGPLMDASLVRADAFFGFYWPDFLTLANETPYLPTILQTAYHSFISQLICLPLLLAVWHPKRLFEFSANATLAAFIVVITAIFVPAIGPLPYFNPPVEAYSAFDQMAGDWHLKMFETLRSGQAVLIDRGYGLITFPSFHTAGAIVICYNARSFPKFIFYPVILLNILLVIGAVPLGSHYLVDIFGGAIAAAISILIARACQPQN